MKVSHEPLPASSIDPKDLMPHPKKMTAVAMARKPGQGETLVVMMMTSCQCSDPQCPAWAKIPLLPAAAHAAGLLLIEAATDAGFVPTGTN